MSWLGRGGRSACWFWGVWNERVNTRSVGRAKKEWYMLATEEVTKGSVCYSNGGILKGSLSTLTWPERVWHREICYSLNLACSKAELRGSIASSRAPPSGIGNQNARPRRHQSAKDLTPLPKLTVVL